MKNVPRSAVAAATLFTTFALLAGCGSKDSETGSTSGTTPAATTAASASAEKGAATTVAAVTGQPKGSIKVGDRALCAICAVKEGTKETEEVKAVLDYKDKTYGFCNESEKAEFISNPTKYAQAQ